MNFVVLTIFPEMFDPFWTHGIIRRAIEHKKIFPSTVNIRDYAEDRHQVGDVGVGQALVGPRLREVDGFAVDHEAALHLDDVLTRRTRLSIECTDRGVDGAPFVASTMKKAPAMVEALPNRSSTRSKVSSPVSGNSPRAARSSGSCSPARSASRPSRSSLQSSPARSESTG